MRVCNYLIMIIVGPILMTGCTSLKRYSSLADPGIDNKLADVNLFGLSLYSPEPGKNTKSLWDLSADAQSQFIKILNTRYPDNAMFLNSFNLEYMKENAAISPDNYVNRDLRMVFSVSKIRDLTGRPPLPGIKISPADRLEYIRITLRIPEDSVLQFKSWNKYTTEYGSVDIGNVSFSKTVQLNASGSYDNGKAGGDVSAGGSSTLTRREDQTLRHRYILLNGKLTEKSIEMEEEGTREIDLTGNVIADVSLGFNSFPETLTIFSGLRDVMGEFNDPGRVNVGYSMVSVPLMREIADTLKGELEMEFVYRNVIRGSKTFPEWDDRVKYYTGNVKKTIPLFTARDYVPDFYCIGTDQPFRELLKIKTLDESLCILKFRSYNEAVEFYSWLMQYLIRNENQTSALFIKGQPMIFRGDNLTCKQIKGDRSFRILPYY